MALIAKAALPDRLRWLGGFALFPRYQCLGNELVEPLDCGIPILPLAPTGSTYDAEIARRVDPSLESLEKYRALMVAQDPAGVYVPTRLDTRRRLVHVLATGTS